MLHAGSFRTRLLVLVLLLIVPTILLALIGNFRHQRLEKDRARERATTIAKLAAGRQEYYVRETRQLLATMTQFPILVQLQDKKASEVGLKNLKLLSPDYDDFGLIETNGILFCHTLGTNVIGPISTPLISKVLKAREFVGEVYLRDTNVQPTLQFAYPVRSTNGELLRVMYASLKTDLLLNALKDVPVPEGGVINVCDVNGSVLVSFPTGEKLAADAPKGETFIKESIEKQDGVFETTGINGERRLYAVSAVRHHNVPLLFVTVGIPQREFFAEADKRLVASSIFILLVMALLLTLAWWYSDRVFLRPLSAMAAAAQQITDGNLAARSGVPRGRSDLHKFAERFDQMAESLQRRHGELESANVQIKRHNLELEQRVAERTSDLEHLNQELEAFSYSVSHDLRAPLRHVNGFAQMLAQNPVLDSNSQAQRHLGLIVSSAKQMGTLIDDLLSFSRMGRQSLHLRTVDVAQMVSEIVHELQVHERDREIQWIIESLPEVEADPATLRQVWVNLISNALKYTRRKSPAVISVTSETKDGEIIFAVSDNGDGFDMAFADKLFGVFQRLHSAEEFEGTGIGLANVRRIISRHGGRTWAEGKVGQGATFWFSLLKLSNSQPEKILTL
jgi:signal transduction histidine kinase